MITVYLSSTDNLDDGIYTSAVYEVMERGP